MSFDSIPIPRPISLPEEAGSTWLETLHEWVTTVDHKKLGLMYIGYALLFLVIGGIEATIMRIQLAVPHARFVSPQVFNRMFTMHATTMIFFVAMPILFGFGTYLIPLMIGTRDMAFPRLNALSFWLTALSGHFSGSLGHEMATAQPAAAKACCSPSGSFSGANRSRA